MDELDRKIVEILREDASTPLTAVAKRLQVPEPTVYFRVNRMKRRGTIKFTLSVSGVDEAERRGFLRAALVYPKNYGLSEMSEKVFERIGVELAGNPDVVFAARVGEAILVVWRGDAFKPGAIEGVKRVEEKEVYSYK